MNSQVRQNLARWSNVMRSAILDAGWEPVEMGLGLPSIALLEVETAAGLKSAHAYFEVWPEVIRLSGTYYSEGGNALAACMVDIKHDALEGDLEAAFARFAQAAQVAIDGSYARRLFLNRKNNPAERDR